MRNQTAVLLTRFFPNLPGQVLMVFVFALASLAYSVATWSRGPAVQILPNLEGGFVLHMLGHAMFGGLVALSTRRLDLILMTAGVSILVDMDHVGTMMGWPTAARACHSIGFLVLGPAVLGLLSTKVNTGLRPLPAAALTIAAILAHIGWDSVSAPGVPLFLPVSDRTLGLNTPMGVLFEVAGIAATWVAMAAPQLPAFRRLPFAAQLSK